MPFCRLPRLGTEDGCQNTRAADGALAAAGRLPPRGSESRARYHTSAHHSSCVNREVLDSGMATGWAAGCLAPTHLRRTLWLRVYVFLAAGKVCGPFPLPCRSLWSHETLLWPFSWRMGSRGQACSTLCSAGCLCASLTSVSGYLCLGNIDRWAETSRPQHKAPCKPVVWNPGVHH